MYGGITFQSIGLKLMGLKIASGCYAIKMAKHIHVLSSKNLNCLYYSLVHSHLNYGNILWGSAYQYRLHKLVKLQNKCVYT